MTERLALRLKNNLAEIARMSQAVADWCQAQALPDEVGFQLDLVLDELVSNVIRHGIKDDKEHFIDVRLVLDGQEITLEVEDDGIPFNPLDIPTPDLDQPIEERRIGGLGIHLVRQIMHDLAYQRRDNKNHLSMKKRLEEES